MDRVKIFQIFYREDQVPNLDPSFIPYDNRGKTYPFNYEYAVFFDLYKSAQWNETDLMGTASWKFHSKTGIFGQDVLSYINENPGKDVYFVNPFPELCFYQSVWTHGEEFHPDLKRITSNLLQACGYNTDILELETPPRLTAYCNYWVANKQFWDSYIEFIQPLWNYILHNKNEITETLLLPADRYIKAPYLPFIFERLFSTFLSQSTFNVASIPISPAKILDNPYLSPIKNQIEEISKSPDHSKISIRDRILIRAFFYARKLRHYYAPLLVRKFRARP